MANIRNNTALDGIGVRSYTAKYDASIVYDATKNGGSVGYGRALTQTGQNTVGLAADADVIIGSLGTVQADGNCTVNGWGMLPLPAGTAAAVTPGTKACGALLAGAKGYIRNCANDTEISNSMCRIVDATDTANVYCRL